MTTVFRTELKLLLRHWGVWIVAAGGLFLAYDIGRSQSAAGLPYWIDESYLRFFLLGPLLLSVAAARRSATERVDELISALPYRPWAWVLGRYLAGFAVWLTLSATGWLFIYLQMRLRGEAVEPAVLALHWLVSAPVSVAVTSAVGFALGYLPGGSIVGFTGAMGYYFASISVPMLTRPPRLFLDFLAPQHWLPLSTAGYFPNGALVLWNRVFACGLAVALTAAVVWVLARRRRQSVLAPLAALVLAVAVAVTGALGTQRVLADRNREIAADAALWEGRRAVAPAAGQIAADRYDLSVQFSPDAHELSVRGEFDVTNISGKPLDRFDLSLRANFQVQSVTAPDGRPLPFTRDGDSLTVEAPLAPNETLRLTAAWSGKVWQWQPASGSMLYWGDTLGAHVGTGSILLPATYGWYPLPLRATLAIVSSSNCRDGQCDWVAEDVAVAVPPAEFALRTTGSGLTIVTNAGEGRIPGLYVVGTRLASAQDERYVSAAHRTGVASVLDLLQQRAEMLGVTQNVTRVIEMPTGTAYGWQYGIDQRQTPGAVLIRECDLAAAADGTLEKQRMGMAWWGDPQVPSVLRAGVGAYLDWALAGALPGSLGEDPPSLVIKSLMALDQAHGRDAALAVVRDLRAADATKVNDFIRIVNAAAKGDQEIAATLSRLEVMLR